MVRLLEPVTYQVQKVEIKMGRKLSPGEKSLSGLYGLVSHQKGRLLRVAMDPKVVEALEDLNSRYVVECYINAKGGGVESVS